MEAVDKGTGDSLTDTILGRTLAVTFGDCKPPSYLLTPLARPAACSEDQDQE